MEIFQLLILNEIHPFAVLISIIIILGLIIFQLLKNPYKFPYYHQQFNVSGKRNIKIENYIDDYLRTPGNWQAIQNHIQVIATWKEKSQRHAETCVLKKRRLRQLQLTIDDAHAFCFETIRLQTRYRQKNYVRTSYKVVVPYSYKSVSFEYLKNRYHILQKIGFETTLNDYEQKNQRKLMTPALKNQIKLRDNYTCQICGKYMPDEVGLQIDHIIPIAQGGKSIPSNLQVLCSKCNGRKGSKI